MVKVMNRTLVNIIENQLGENPNKRDFLLADVKFTLNNMVKRSRRKSIFINIFRMWWFAELPGGSVTAKHMAKKTVILHVYVKKKLKELNDRYIEVVNKNMYSVLKEGDMVNNNKEERH